MNSISFFKLSLCTIAAATLTLFPCYAGLRLPSIIGDNMVLQRDQKDSIWGWADPGQSVTVEFAGQSVSGKADASGKWKVQLAPLKTSAEGRSMKITAGGESRTLKNILVGEVWICSGQSNMQFAVTQAYNADLDIPIAKFPNIRLITVPQVGTQEIQDDFKGEWKECSPETVGDFSAVGYFFGRQIYQTIGVPVGLIDDSWGGSAAEAWVPRKVIEKDPRFKGVMDQWKATESSYDHQAAVAKWKAAAAKAKAAGKNPPRPPRNPLTGQHRPGNLYAGVLHPTIGYGIRGVIWYQGESNAGRAYQYDDLFKLMITQWRKEWGEGDFPFYWVQLADYQNEVAEPGGSSWAELRESQTHTLALPNTGQAVIYDIGEGRDIHPRNKLEVGKRLARIALARDYGKKIAYLSPRFDSMEIKGNKVLLTFKNVGRTLYSFDTRDVKGFAVAGADRKWHWATGKVMGKDKVEVTCAAVPNPVAVRYGWAENPVANLRSYENLPVDPFRTDDWPGITEPKK